MIYEIIIVDADSGILLLERQMKILDKKPLNKNETISSEILAAFFNVLNTMIDDIQIFMKKGRDVSNMTRIVTSEGSTIILHYQPQARVLMCSISDPDDDPDKIVEILKILGKRFWQKHRMDIEIFRKENIREIFNSFIVEIDTHTLEGKVAEKFPKLLVALGALERIKMMGIIDDQEYIVAKMCNGKNSHLKISKEIELNTDGVKRILNKLSDLDVIKN